MSFKNEVELLADSTGNQYRYESGKRLSTFYIGGDLHLVEVQSQAALVSLFKELDSSKYPYRVLGNGSNVLLPDSSEDLIYIKLGREFKTYTNLFSGTFQVNGAMSLMVLARKLAQSGYAGLEFAGGIPASFAGAVKMNAGAHTAEMSDIIKSVSIILAGGETLKLSGQELKFDYRKTYFPDGSMIYAGEIELQEGEQESIEQKLIANLDYRKNTQPLTIPSAGSTFKNPEGHYAGALIEGLGFKGTAAGSAEVSHLHANWVVNPNKEATAADVKQLISQIQEAALDKHNISLEPELQIL